MVPGTCNARECVVLKNTHASTHVHAIPSDHCQTSWGQHSKRMCGACVGHTRERNNTEAISSHPSRIREEGKDTKPRLTASGLSGKCRCIANTGPCWGKSEQLSLSGAVCDMR